LSTKRKLGINKVKLNSEYKIIKAAKNAAFVLVPRRGLEPLSLAAYAPQAYLYTNSNTWAKVYPQQQLRQIIGCYPNYCELIHNTRESSTNLVK